MLSVDLFGKLSLDMYFPPHPIPIPCGERIQATSNQRRATSSWRRGWDSFSPLVLLVLRSRPPSLSFALLTFPPTEAFGSASNPTFFSLCFFSRDIRHTKYDIRVHGGEGGIRTHGTKLGHSCLPELACILACKWLWQRICYLYLLISISMYLYLFWWRMVTNWSQRFALDWWSGQ